MRLLFTWFGLIICIAGISASAGQAADVSPLAEAMKKASQDGRPVLVMGTRRGCPLCAAFKRRLAKDAALRPLLASYLPAELDVDSANTGMRELQKRKGSGGEMLPFVYLVRADGEIISVVSGQQAINGPFDQVLREGITKSGRPLQPAEVAKLSAALEKAKAAQSRQDAGQALALLAPAAKLEGFAAVLIESHKVLSTIKDQATKDVTECERLFKEPDKLLPAAVNIAEASKKYARLPDQKKVLMGLSHKVGQQDKGRDVLAQAEEIVCARELAKSKKTDLAAQAYEQIVTKHPDTAAATLATEELAALRQQGHK